MAANAKTKYDLISDTSKRTQATNNADTQQDKHRELIFEVNPNKSYSSFLKFKDDQYTWYNVPLGNTTSKAKKDAHGKEDNILVPVIPLCYTTPACDPKETAAPREGGYLYIYVDDYLWRELEVLKGGFFQDVNLQQHQGKDSRPATVERDNRILLPHKINGTDTIVELCFSEIQWSWARINSMGGMDKEDFRINRENPPYFASDMNISKAKAAENRTARMQEMDLSGYSNGFPVTQANGNKSRIENSASSASSLYTIRLHKKSSLPVVYLHDPLGTALQNIHDYYYVHSNLISTVESIKLHEHYKSAVYAYHAFFNKRVQEKVTWKSRGRGGTRTLTTWKNKDETSKLFRDVAEEIDQPYLEETILGVKERQKLRVEIRDLKKVHVEFLDGKFNGKDIKATHSDFVSFNSAILDYAELPIPYYLVLWSAMHAMVHFLNHDPSRIDSALDIKKYQDKVKPADDPGVKYMKSLLQHNHPLHKALFPKKTDVNEYVEKYDVKGKKPEKPDGTGNFRAVAFAKSFESLSQKPLETMKLVDAAVKQADKTLADFITAFKKQWTVSLNGKITIEGNVLVRLIKAACLSSNKGLHILEKGASTTNVTVMSGRVTILSQIMKAQREGNITQDKKGVKVIDPDTKEIIGYVDPKQLPNYKGTPIRATKDIWNSIFSKSGKARFEMIAVSLDSKYTSEFHLAFKGKITENIDVERTPNGLKMTGKVLAPIIAALEMFNFITAVNESNKSGLKKDKTKTVLAFLGLLHAGITTSVALIGEKKTAEIMTRGLGRKAGNFVKGSKVMFGKNIKLLGAAGGALTGIGAAMSAWDMYDCFDNDDDDAATMYGLQAVALVGLAIAGFVEAGAIFLGMGPIGWAFLALGILFGFLAYWFTDTPIEKWAKHGPFSVEVDARMTKEMSVTTKDSTGKEITKPISAHDTLERLMSLLMTPTIKIKEDVTTNPESIAVEIYAPGFRVGKSTLEVDVAACLVKFHRGTAQRSMESRCIPLKVTNILDKKTNQIVGIKYNYYFRHDKLKYQIIARGRHITEEQIFIPRVVKHDTAVYSTGKNGRLTHTHKFTSKPSKRLFHDESRKDKSWVHSDILTFSSNIINDVEVNEYLNRRYKTLK